MLRGPRSPVGSETTADVLVVDDEPIVRDAVRLVLEGEGFRVASANDGGAGLAHPALSDCRIVLCDLMLPDCPGTDVVRRIRALRPDVPVVVITGYATAATNAEAMEAGATDFLPKPFDDEELLGAVRRVLGVPVRADSAPPPSAGRSTSGGRG